mmetsp:Transcript_124040/g.358724  ORF Transcript_124040/g.358724 Transcript_124040/m.358724 type:complete len:296 (+) Transcript_124040:548-1435(+)
MITARCLGRRQQRLQAHEVADGGFDIASAEASRAEAGRAPQGPLPPRLLVALHHAPQVGHVGPTADRQLALRGAGEGGPLQGLVLFRLQRFPQAVFELHLPAAAARRIADEAPGEQGCLKGGGVAHGGEVGKAGRGVVASVCDSCGVIHAPGFGPAPSTLVHEHPEVLADEHLRRCAQGQRSDGKVLERRLPSLRRQGLGPRLDVIQNAPDAALQARVRVAVEGLEEKTQRASAVGLRERISLEHQARRSPQQVVRAFALGVHRHPGEVLKEQDPGILQKESTVVEAYYLLADEL